MSEIAGILIERAVRAVSERRYCDDFGLDAMPPELSEHFNRSAVPACVETDVQVTLEAVAAADLYEALERIVDCYGVGSTPEQFCRNVSDFMLEGFTALARARGEA